MESLTGLIIAVVGVGIAMVGVVISMMFWVRSQFNILREERKEHRHDLMTISLNLDMAMVSIKKEMKDFHQRILEIQKAGWQHEQHHK